MYWRFNASASLPSSLCLRLVAGSPGSTTVCQPWRHGLKCTALWFTTIHVGIKRLCCIDATVKLHCCQQRGDSEIATCGSSKHYDYQGEHSLQTPKGHVELLMRSPFKNKGDAWMGPEASL